MIHRLANFLANKFSGNLGTPEEVSVLVSEAKGSEVILDNKEECIEILAYSFEVLIGKYLQLSVMTVLALLAGVLDYFVGVIFAFTFIRKFCGGFHAKSFSRCFIISIMMISVEILYAMLLKDYLFLIIPNIILSIIFIKMYAPIGCEEKPIKTEEERIWKRKISFERLAILIVLSLVIIGIGVYTSINWILAIGCGVSTGLLMSGFNITPFGHKVLGAVENIITFGRKEA